MPVQIDEVTAEIEPSRSEQAPTAPRSSTESSPETELRKQHDLQARLAVRSARVCAD